VKVVVSLIVLNRWYVTDMAFPLTFRVFNGQMTRPAYQDDSNACCVKHPSDLQRAGNKLLPLVMNAMDKPDLDISRDQAHATLWREGAILLGELKAMESLGFGVIAEQGYESAHITDPVVQRRNHS